MLSSICETCQKINKCSIKDEQRCEVACMWPQKCRCGKTENVKVILEWGGVGGIAYSVYAICRECFFIKHYDFRDEWDKLKLPPFTEDGRNFVIKSADKIIREYINDGNLNISKRIYKKDLYPIIKELEVYDYEILSTIRDMRLEQGIRINKTK